MDASSEVRTQELLQPVTLELSPVERAALADEHERLAAAGFDIEPFGGDAWILRGVPEALGVGRGLDVLMRSLASEESECTAAAAHDARARIMARVACHAAVTAGVTLTTERMNEVLASLWGTANPSTCPHGRPTVLRLDLPFIERRSDGADLITMAKRRREPLPTAVTLAWIRYFAGRTLMMVGMLVVTGAAALFFGADAERRMLAFTGTGAAALRYRLATVEEAPTPSRVSRRRDWSRAVKGALRCSAPGAGLEAGAP